MRLLFVLIFFSLFQLFLQPDRLAAQQVDCTINVNYEAVASTHSDLLVDFASDVQYYVNSNRWGNDDLDQKIQCAINIFIKSAAGDNRYSAQAFIGSQRPIYRLEKSSGVARLFDETWEFTYIKGRPIRHDLYTFNDLASFLDFYVLLIIGYDYDTYDSYSGTPFFQKASNVASLGRSSGLRGWQQSASTFSRFQLVDELLNPKFAPIRNASYLYHFRGLDSLAFSPPRAMKNISDAIDIIGKTRNQLDPRNFVVRTFFDAKYQELAELFREYGDAKGLNTLISIDPSHQTAYEQARDGKKK